MLWNSNAPENHGAVICRNCPNPGRWGWDSDAAKVRNAPTYSSSHCHPTKTKLLRRRNALLRAIGLASSALAATGRQSGHFTLALNMILSTKMSRGSRRNFLALQLAKKVSWFQPVMDLSWAQCCSMA